MIKQFKTPLILLLIVVILMFLVNGFSYRLDLTHDQRYSLSTSAIQQLQEIDAPLRIDVFLTGKLPYSYRQFKSELDILLRQIQRYKKNVLISYNDPFELGDEETVIREMQQYGMTPERAFEMQDGNRKESILFPWMIVNFGQRSERIPLIERQLGDTEEQVIQQGLQQLEYRIFDGIHKVTHKNKSNIAVLSSHKTSKSVTIADLLQSIKPYYNLASFDLKNPTISPQRSLENLLHFQLMIISNPQEHFNETEKFILDQYELSGGRLLWLVDGIGMDRDSLFNTTGTAYGFPLDLQLDDYFFHRGVRINKQLIKDLYCAPIVLANGTENNTQYIPYPWPYYPLSKPEATTMGKDLGPVITQFVSPLDTLANPLRKTILLKTSAFTKTLGTPVVMQLEEATEKIQPAQFNEEEQFMGVLLQGASSSLFLNKIKPFTGPNIKNQGVIKSAVFSDGNIAENQTDKGKFLPLGYDKWTNNNYANKNLLMNVIHDLCNASDRLQLRSKTWQIVRLDKQKMDENAIFWKWITLFTTLTLGLVSGGAVYLQRSKHLAA